eukprot:303601_1
MSIGSYNSSIFIIGGTEYLNQVTEYRIAPNRMIDHGATALSVNIRGTGQSYVQLQNIIYTISFGGYLCSYDMSTKTFNGKIATIPVHPSYRGCLAATNVYLIITGGDANGAINTVQILNINAMTWNTNVPSMIYARRSHSCVINPNTNILYVMGGTGRDDIQLSSIEKASLLGTWTHVSDLSVTASATRAVIIDNDIWVIGGQVDSKDNSWYRIDIVHIINTLTDVVTIGEPLPYRVYASPCIIVDNILYCFGGRDGNIYFHKWMKFYFGTVPQNTVGQTTLPALTTFEQTNTSAHLYIVIGCVAVVIVTTSGILVYIRCKKKKHRSEKTRNEVVSTKGIEMQTTNSSAPLEQHTEQQQQQQQNVNYINSKIKQDINEDYPKKLLETWGLAQYFDEFNHTGWDDVTIWNELINYDDQLNNIFKLKVGHKVKFVKHVKEKFSIEQQVEGKKEGAKKK